MNTNSINTAQWASDQFKAGSQSALKPEKISEFNLMLEEKMEKKPVSFETFWSNATCPVSGRKLTEKGGVSVDEIKAFHVKESKKVDAVLKNTLTSLGISRNESLTLKEGQDGSIQVTSDLSDAINKRLEQALNENDEFKTAFGHCRRSAGMIEMLKFQSKFSEEYDKNPMAAVEKYGIGKRSMNVNTIYQYGQGVGRYLTSLYSSTGQ